MPGYPQISEDLSALVSLLNSHGVKFIVVSSHALAFHGVPRFTEDIDFFVDRSSINVQHLAKALEEFGVGMSQESQAELSRKERGVIFVGRKPNRADFLNFLDGVSFDSAESTKVAEILAGQPVYFISLEDYVATKRASGRPKDLQDLTLLASENPKAVEGPSS